MLIRNLRKNKMATWYSTNNFNNKIGACEFEKETKMYLFHSSGYKRIKASAVEIWHKSIEDAVAYLRKRHERRIEWLQTELERVEKALQALNEHYPTED